MRTAIETGRDGITPLRVYHAAGKDDAYTWTHEADKATRAECTACQQGTIPGHIRGGRTK